jgi:uncharacterized membrane protein
MGITLGFNPAVVLVIAMGASVVIFFTVRLGLNTLYDTTLMRWHWFKYSTERIRTRGLPLTAKYGLIGLAAFAAIPLPGTGVYGATILSWLLGIKWQVSLLVILPGAAISNSIITLSALSIAQAMNLAD